MRIFVATSIALAFTSAARGQQPWRLPKSPPDRAEWATSGDVLLTSIPLLITLVRRVETKEFATAQPDVDAAAALAQSPREKMFVAAFETWLSATTGDAARADAAWAQVLATGCFRSEDLEVCRQRIAYTYAPAKTP